MKKITIRINDKDVMDYINKLERRGMSKTDVLVEALKQKMDIERRGIKIPTEDGGDKDEKIKTEKVVKPVKKLFNRNFEYPIGEVVGTFENGRVESWWCPPQKLDEVREKCRDWVENGFILWEGEPLEDDLCGRGKDFTYSPSSKLMEARRGDIEVRLIINDPYKALEFMRRRSDIPVAPVDVDLIRYTEDDTYKQAVDLAITYFKYYFQYGKPKPLNIEHSDTTLLEEL